MTFGLSAGAIAMIGAGAAVGGGLIAANGAKSAANTQAEAANNATAQQTDMFNKTVELESPFRSAGLDAQNRLSYLLGLSPNGYGAPSTTGTPTATAAQPISAAPAAPSQVPYGTPTSWDADGNQIAVGYGRFDPQTLSVLSPTGQPMQPAATPQAMAPSASGMSQGMSQGAPNDPAYGSLMHDFGMQDFQLDPGIQFQMQQGQQALQNSQAAKNGVLSGAAMKDLIGFNQGMAGTGYQSAFDRYQANRQFKLGSLMDMTKLGQAAAGNTVNAAGGFSSGIAGTITGAGNASAAGTVGSANAISGGLNGAMNSYYLSKLLNNGGGTSGVPGTTGGGVIADNPIQNFA